MVGGGWLAAVLPRIPVSSDADFQARAHFVVSRRVAEQLRPRKVEDFKTLEHLREDMIRSIGDYRLERDRVIVADFDRDSIDPAISVSRMFLIFPE